MNWIDAYQSSIPSPFAWVQNIFLKLAGPNAMAQEEAHIEGLKSIGYSDSDVIGYLYDRLNIIDQKTQVIMTLNTISLGALTLTFQVALNGPSKGIFGHPYLATAMFCSSALALVLAFAISRLRFDHIARSSGAGKAAFNVDHYRTDFYRITIARQIMLSVARVFTVLAFVFFSIMLVPKLL
jgi:hypothetical protein